MQTEKEISPLPEQHPDLIASRLDAQDKDKPEMGATYEIRPDGPVSVRFEAHDPEDPQNGWSSVKRWRGESGRRMPKLGKKLIRVHFFALTVLFVALFVTYTSACESR